MSLSELPETLPLVDGELLFWKQCDLGAAPSALLQQLLSETPWRQEDITLWGKTHKQPRLIAWYGDPGRSYSYSGTTLEPTAWTQVLSRLRRRVEALTGSEFNSVLLNYYRNGQDSMGMHADDEPELGKNPVIASLSLGEVRTFVMQHRKRKELETVKLELPSGSLLLMRGATQANWKHGLPKRARVHGARVNLTFRQILG